MHDSFLHGSWHRCLTEMGGQRMYDASLGLYQRLLTAYAEPQRAYHTCQHLAECLILCQRFQSLAENPREVELALWFHDVVYAIHGQDNEKESAAWAHKAMAELGLRDTVRERVATLILASTHHQHPTTTDQQLLVDIDLAILGTPPQRFAEYEQQIRIEFHAIPLADFCRGRGQILATLHARKPLYHTPALRLLFEDRAHSNLEAALTRLSAYAQGESVTKL